MKERPILFSAPMVRALLDGTKTQTRRVIKPHARDGAFVLLDHGGGWWPYRSEGGESTSVDNMGHPLVCPYGKPGDRLWVKETWARLAALNTAPIVYRADYPASVPAGIASLRNADAIKWKSSLFMPRAASRILLEVVSVRVEPLQDVSIEDAIAEGIRRVGSGWERCCPDPAVTEHAGSTPDPRLSYRGVWEAINGPGSWDVNPWVWVVEFTRLSGR